MSHINEKQFYHAIMENAWNDIRSSISDLWQMTAIAIAAIALTINVLFVQQGSTYLFNLLTGWFVMAFLFTFLGYFLLTVFWTTDRIESRSDSVVEASKKATASSFDFAVTTGTTNADGRVSVDKSKELPMMEFPTSYFRWFFGTLWTVTLIVWLFETFIISVDLLLRTVLLMAEILGMTLSVIILYKNR